MSKFIPNSFMVANAFVDEAMGKLSDASVKIYLLINRKTRGWAKEYDALSLRQLESLSKKSKPTVVRCLNELEEVGLIKKHHQSKYGNVYSLLDSYDLGEWVKFPTKKVMVKTFIHFEKELVKNFYHFGYGEKIAQKPVEFYLNIGGKKSLLVKNFYHLKTVDNLPKWSNIFTTTNGKWLNILTTGGKEFLPQVVKNFNPQSNTIKRHYQNKKNWLSFENLKIQIISLNNSVDVDEVFNALWFKTELDKFELYNAGRDHSDEMMIYFFAEWLIKALVKHQKQTVKSKTNPVSKTNPEFLRFASPSQLYMFANKLAHHPDVIKKFSSAGESYESLAGRIAAKLSDPNELQNWKEYLQEVGFKSKGRGAA
ncbi:hypothetical protein [Acinetobacter wuhouensis]|uniref:Bacteriophage lambda Replication protein O N-terminal domain-containing protein n=1 Tax=Acinetobacter wuhouensis TaxID=1879050 RepID=A0A4Q7AIK5_9GAMM|nr:hypothetical protein [Acinetobacter wuhouensis]RZG48089.1 hypothetical protein EXU28_04805 [Acinetobacter wuhouensis]